MEPHVLTPPGHLVRKRSLHIIASHRCQNDCVFCSDGGARVRIQRPDPATVRAILEQNRGHEIVCFSTHEPTLHPDLVTFVSWARELDYPTVSLITNGRTLARGGLARRLVEAGLGDLHVSIHGHEAAVHDAITRRPGSFDQALAGLDAALALRRDHDLVVTAHSTLSALNLAGLHRMVPFFLDRGVDHYGLNGLFIEGLAVENFDALALPYPQIADALARALAGPPRPVSVSDIPPCMLVGRIPVRAIGMREDFHMAVDGEEGAPLPTEASSVVRRYAFGPPCEACALRTRCDGVASAYIARFGWDEFRPVHARDLAPTEAFETEETLRALVTSGTGEWEVGSLALEPARARIQVTSPAVPQVLTLLIEPLDPGAPAYRRTGRFNLSLQGRSHGAAEVSLADRVFDGIETKEKA
jgi:MoaA/NifB/PqqE/SkfB family radical SAM enzyme